MFPQTFHVIAQKLDHWRLKLHFQRVEWLLRQRDVSHLPIDLQTVRTDYLEKLRAYGERGIFPRHHEAMNYAPCFIDQQGRECAVAHLMLHSKQRAFAYQIAERANYAYVPDMHFPELDLWASGTGFTKKELALIQPGYYETFSGGLMTASFVAWVWAIGIFFVNVLRLKKSSDWGNRWRVMPILAWLVLIPLLGLGLYCLWEALAALSLSRNIDVGVRIASQAKDAANGLLIGGITSLSLSLALGLIALYRLHYQAKKKRDIS